MAQLKVPAVLVRFSPVIGLAAVAAVLYFARQLMIPIALAMLLTFLLAPMVRRMERVRVPRIIAVVVGIMLTMVTVLGVAWVVQSQVVEFADNLPQYRENIIRKFETLRASKSGILGKAGDAIADMAREIDKSSATPKPGAPPASATPPVEPMPVRIVGEPIPPLEYLRTMFGPLLEPLGTALLVIVFATFMLLNREDLRNRLIRLVGADSLHQTTSALDNAAQRVSRYLVMQSVANCFAGLAIGIGLFLIGVPNASLWALLTALLRFIPFIGVWVAACLPVAVSMASSPGWGQPLEAMGVIFVVEVVSSHLLEPWLVGKGTGLSPLAVLVAAAFWTWLWGPVGLIVSTPLTVCLSVIGRYVPQFGFVEVLVGDSPALTPETRFYQRLLADDQEEAARIAAAAAKEMPLSEVCDTLVLPVLRLVQAGRTRGDLDDERSRSVREMLETIFEDVSARQDPPAVEVPVETMDPGGMVVCVQARDQAESLASRVATSALTMGGVPAISLVATGSTAQLFDQIAEQSPALILVSAVPPGAFVHARVLCKRLRGRFPGLPIVVGLWDASIETDVAQERLGQVDAEHVVTNLAEALRVVRGVLFPGADALEQNAAPEAEQTGAGLEAGTPGGMASSS